MNILPKLKTAGRVAPLTALVGLLGTLAAYAQTATPAPAAAAPTPTLDTGNTAWMLTSTALVLMMTIPGLALFYGGMVRKKNVLATIMQSFAICCLVTVLWFVVGYSLAFSDGGSWNSFIGGFSKVMHKGITVSTLWLPGVSNIPEFVFSMFQMTFAIITPALIAGAFAERMKFSALLLFSGLWLIFMRRSRIGSGAVGSSVRPACWTSRAVRSSTSMPASPAWSAPWCSASARATEPSTWRPIISSTR